MICLKKYYYSLPEQVRKCLTPEEIHCFYNKIDSYIFTSFKVASTSLRQKSFTHEIQRVYEVDYKKNIYGLYRCPKQRLESFYKNKILFSSKKENQKWEPCQPKIFEIFGLERFLNSDITYEEFINEAVEELSYKDVHLLPQTYYIPSFVEKHIQLLQYNPILEKKFYITTIENKTSNIKFNYTKKMINNIETIYKKDYLRFFNHDS